jgi:hypothetical protein
MGEMRLYHVQYDDESYFIESESFGNCVKVWQAFMRNADDNAAFNDEPESVHMIHDGPVLR